jgi:hypothetical protein
MLSSSAGAPATVPGAGDDSGWAPAAAVAVENCSRAAPASKSLSKTRTGENPVRAPRLAVAPLAAALERIGAEEGEDRAGGGGGGGGGSAGVEEAEIGGENRG